MELSIARFIRELWGEGGLQNRHKTEEVKASEDNPRTRLAKKVLYPKL